FSYAQAFAEANHIPIHVGEFGALSTADMASRRRWATFLARWFESQHMRWAYGEFNAGVGIYNPATGELVEPLVDALLHNAMPDPIPVVATTVYTSDFSNDTDGWWLGLQGGASGNITATGGNLNVSIGNLGSESWHVQLVKNNIPLHKDKMYRISFKARATTDRNLIFYAGKASDPWSAYSSSSVSTIGTTETSFSASFTMAQPTDLESRLVFDLGQNISAVTITEVKVEALQILITAVDDEIKKSRLIAYPNPVDSWLYIDQLTDFRRAELFDAMGRLSTTFAIQPDATAIDLTGIPQGLYVLRLSGNGKDDHVRIVKR